MTHVIYHSNRETSPAQLICETLRKTALVKRKQDRKQMKLHKVPLIAQGFSCSAVVILSSKNIYSPKTNGLPRDRGVGVVCVCVLQRTQKTHCWPDPKQHSRLFPTDREGLVSHSATGPIYCLWLQKTGNRSHSKRARVQLTEQTAEMLLQLFNCMKPEKRDREKPKTTSLATNDSRKSFTLNIAKLNYTLTDNSIFNLLKRCLTTARRKAASLQAG